MIVFASIGFLGQQILSQFEEPDKSARGSFLRAFYSTDPGTFFSEKVAKRRWFPLRSMNAEEYKQLLEERLLRVDAEISLVEEDIHKLRCHVTSPAASKNFTFSSDV